MLSPVIMHTLIPALLNLFNVSSTYDLNLSLVPKIVKNIKLLNKLLSSSCKSS